MARPRYSTCGSKGEPMARVLVIDDEPEVTDIVTLALSECGHEVISALHAGDGLMLFDVEGPDVVVVDLRMPGMSGIEVLQQIRDRRPELPVIVISAYADAAIAQQCLDRGAVGFIRKPFAVEHLEDAVAGALNRN